MFQSYFKQIEHTSSSGQDKKKEEIFQVKTITSKENIDVP